MKNSANIEIAKQGKIVKRCARHATALAYLKGKDVRELWKFTLSYEPVGTQREVRKWPWKHIPAAAYIFGEMGEKGQRAQEEQQKDEQSIVTGNKRAYRG